MRVILDTNVLLSALIRRDSVPGRVLEAWFDDRFVLITHELQLEELRVVTRRQQILALSEAGRPDLLVTGDKAGLLRLGSHNDTRIQTARAFLDRLTGK